MALFNLDLGTDNHNGLVIRFNKNELPCFCQWKLAHKGFYVPGFEPGTVTPLGQGRLRDKGKLPCIEAQEKYSIPIEFSVIDSLEEIAALEEEAFTILNG